MNDTPIAYIGMRDTGKSTRLYNKFVKGLNEGKRILVIDSATDHPQKSILKKIEKNYQHTYIYTNDERLIDYPDIKIASFPHKIISNSANSQVYLCDAGYFLECGYEYPPGIQRENQRKLYKYFSMQVVTILLDKIDIILMDEIELLPEFQPLIEKIIHSNKELVIALHSDIGLSIMHNMFLIERT